MLALEPGAFRSAHQLFPDSNLAENTRHVMSISVNGIGCHSPVVLNEKPAGGFVWAIR